MTGDWQVLSLISQIGKVANPGNYLSFTVMLIPENMSKVLYSLHTVKTKIHTLEAQRICEKLE